MLERNYALLVLFQRGADEQFLVCHLVRQVAVEPWECGVFLDDFLFLINRVWVFSLQRWVAAILGFVFGIVVSEDYVLTFCVLSDNNAAVL